MKNIKKYNSFILLVSFLAFIVGSQNILAEGSIKNDFRNRAYFGEKLIGGLSNFIRSTKDKPLIQEWHGLYTQYKWRNHTDLRNPDFTVKAFYGDKLLNRVVAIDVDNMILESADTTIGMSPYPVDQAGRLDKVYVVTRGSNSMDVIDAISNENIGMVEMEHRPRSAEAYNAYLGLQLVSGADKPMVSLIDVYTDTVVATVGDDTVYVANGDYGGGIATGHPFWFSNHKFALIDRANRTIYVYKIRQRRNGSWKIKKISSIETPTGIHHLFHAGKKRTFFALAEGSVQNGFSPMVIKYKMKRGFLIEKARISLSDATIGVMGSHHANVHPDGIHVYIGSTEGNMYVLNIRTMEIETIIPVGLGAGHTSFAPDREIAIVTNHKDSFVSIIDTNTHTLIKNVVVSGPQKNGAILQSHTSFVHPDMDFFYAFASDNGIFYELDLDTLEISRTLYTGGTPLQGVFLCDGQSCSGMR